MGDLKNNATVNGLDFATACKWAEAYELTQKVNIDRLLDISEKYTKLKEFIFDSFSWCAGADDGFVVINSDWKVCELLEELEPVAHAIAKKRAYDEKFEAERKKLEGSSVNGKDEGANLESLFKERFEAERKKLEGGGVNG